MDVRINFTDVFEVLGEAVEAGKRSQSGAKINIRFQLSLLVNRLSCHLKHALFNPTLLLLEGQSTCYEKAVKVTQ